jgi:hypothetical protein
MREADAPDYDQAKKSGKKGRDERFAAPRGPRHDGSLRAWHYIGLHQLSPIIGELKIAPPTGAEILSPI